MNDLIERIRACLQERADEGELKAWCREHGISYATARWVKEPNRNPTTGTVQRFAKALGLET